ncbi:MAG: hypothetical protein CMB82_05635 [Flammeovirgaceae bacterium]|nr:hypothetical protein [Flammeovirgaceae bacterium]
MKQITKITLILILAAIGFSCSNKELESRLAKLEGKIAQLETKNGVRTTPVAPTSAKAPDVKPEGPLPSFKFSEESFDFGTITEGDVVDHVFSFVNEGDAPLIISSATASCGCTVPVWPKTPIAPGEEAEIKVQFNSRSKPGIQNKTVTVTANTYPKVTRLKIKANVSKANPS